MRKISLTKGQYALIDDEDYKYLNQWKWQYNKGYARRSWRENGKMKNLTLHRELLKAPKDKQVDHINGDRLDNRKINLRLCTSQGNNRNANSKRGISGYKGVHWYKRDKKWASFITINYKHKYLGYFSDSKEAAKAYNQAAIKYFGKFAKINQL